MTSPSKTLITGRKHLMVFDSYVDAIKAEKSGLFPEWDKSYYMASHVGRQWQEIVILRGARSEKEIEWINCSVRTRLAHDSINGVLIFH